jgi:hypothetical protein
MQIAKHLAITSFSALLLASCGVANSKMYGAHRVDVGIQKADAEKGRPNPVANLLLVSSRSPVTRYKDILMSAAAQESDCTPIEKTFVYRGSTNTVASVELDCG